MLPQSVRHRRPRLTYIDLVIRGVCQFVNDTERHVILYIVNFIDLIVFYR